MFRSEGRSPDPRHTTFGTEAFTVEADLCQHAVGFTPRGSAQFLEIREILESAGGTLGRPHVVEPQNRGLHVAE